MLPPAKRREGFGLWLGEEGMSVLIRSIIRASGSPPVTVVG